MPQSHSYLLTHIVFSTKDRAPVLDDTARPALYAYLATVCRTIEKSNWSGAGIAFRRALLVWGSPTEHLSDSSDSAMRRILTR